MLVLKRRPGERIILSNGVTIMLVSSMAGEAKIGIEAPDDVEIDREEIYMRKQRGQTWGEHELGK